MQIGNIYPFCEAEIAKIGSIANAVKMAISKHLSNNNRMLLKSNATQFGITLNNTEANADNKHKTNGINQYNEKFN